MNAKQKEIVGLLALVARLEVGHRSTARRAFLFLHTICLNRLRNTGFVTM